MMKFERLHQPLAPLDVFLKRLLLSLALAMVLIGVSLAAGMLGYRRLGSMGWVDAFANAAMILSGMGPLTSLGDRTGKVFEGVYALYSGFMVLVGAGLVLAPVLHRFLHYMHAVDDEEEG